MGVPKFFRWLSERYPKINQPIRCKPTSPPPVVAANNANKDETSSVVEEKDAAVVAIPEVEEEESLEDCYVVPEFDRLYIDANGILHGASHNNGRASSNSEDDVEQEEFSQEEIVKNVCYYLDRIVQDIVKPKELLFFAIDGVAPRAKLCQQRSRRYRSGKEQEIMAGLNLLSADDEDINNKGTVERTLDGRYSGTIHTADTAAATAAVDSKSSSLLIEEDDELDEEEFHLNAITPGTKFLTYVSKEIFKHIQHKLATDSRWQHLKVIFSGPEVPGEGEHKIMQFIREQKFSDTYNHNTRHCLFGQDGDLIVLGLATHEPHFCLLREEVKFGPDRIRHEAKALGKSKQEISNDYVLQTNFQFLHMSVLRDYIALELETSNIYADSPYDIERTIDDFCFLTFFVGNDFLPHMPALDIGDGAFDILFHTYRKHRKTWWDNTAADTKGDPYLTEGGKIVSGERLELFLSDLGKHEDPYLWKAKAGQADLYNLIRKDEKKYGRNRRPSLLPSDEQLVTIEQKKLEQYQEMLKSISTSRTSSPSLAATENGSLQEEQQVESSSTSSFIPVTTSERIPAMLKSRPKMIADRNLELSEEAEDDFLKYLSGLVMMSISPQKGGGSNSRFVSSTSSRRSRLSSRKYRITSVGSESNLSSKYKGNYGSNSSMGEEKEEPSTSMQDGDLKGRYYFDKFGFTPVDVEQHQKLRRSYIEGLVWCLEYYYRGCVSWDWYYPYYYGPMFSDLVEIDTYLSEITFDSKRGEPLLPFEQLLACLPPSSSQLLPRPYRWLMTSEQSPIIEYYPVDFACDTAGKRFPWEFTVLLPFIDGNKLSAACRQMVTDEMLSEEERQMNKFGHALLLTYDSSNGTVKETTSSNITMTVGGVNATPYVSKDPADKDAPRFIPAILPKTVLPYPGFSTLMDAPLESLIRRRNGIKVFGTRSRYKTALLNMSKPLPPMPPVQILRKVFVGTTIYIRYPHFLEAFVTAISDESVTCRGDSPPRQWTKSEVIAWKAKRDSLKTQYANGDGTVGSGGWVLPESSVTLSVRPLQQIVATEDGQKVKKFAKFEIEVPITAALWTPSSFDEEKRSLPLLLEKNPYKYGERQKKENTRIVDIFGFIGKDSSSNKEGISSGAYMHSIGLRKQRLYSTLSVLKNNNNFVPSLDACRGTVHSGRHFSCLKQGLKQGAVPSLPIRSFSKCTLEKPALISFHARRSRGFAKAAAALAVLAYAVTKTTASCSQPISFMNRFHCTLADSKPKAWFSCIRGGGVAIHEEEIYQVSDYPPTPPLEFAHGTTTISFLFRDGIVAAVDSRASIGQFVGSKTVQKVLPIHKTMLGTMAGGAADCSYWIRKLRSEAKRFQLEDGDGRTLSVARASMWLSTYLYENRSLNLSVGTMIMGVDQHSGEASIYYTDDQGVRIRGDLFAVGSGSTFALGILDSETDPKTRLLMTEKDAVALAVKAIRHATFRDAYSGGYIGVYVVTKDGWKKVFSEDLALVTVGFDEKSPKK